MRKEVPAAAAAAEAAEADCARFYNNDGATLCGRFANHDGNEPPPAAGRSGGCEPAPVAPSSRRLPQLPADVVGARRRPATHRLLALPVHALPEGGVK